MSRWHTCFGAGGHQRTGSFLPDWVYNWWFPQPDIGLTDLREAVRAMVEEHIPIDFTRMSEDFTHMSDDVGTVHRSYRRAEVVDSNSCVSRVRKRHGTH